MNTSLPQSTLSSAMVPDGFNANSTSEQESPITGLRWIEIIRIALSVLGIFGNLLAFLVFSRPVFSQLSFSVFLRFLAALDISVLITYNVVSLHHTLTTYYTENNGLMHPLAIWFITSLATASAWMLVLVGIERLTAVCFPFKLKTLFTNTRAYISCSMTVAACFLINLHNLLLTPLPGDAFPRPEIFAIWYSGIPSIVIIICNVTVIVKMRDQGTIKEKNKKNKGITIMLIVNCIGFVSLTIALPIYEVFSSNLDSHVRSIIILVTGVNHMVNCLFYGASGSLFRHEIKQLLCGGCVNGPGKGSHKRSTGTDMSTTASDKEGRTCSDHVVSQE